MSAALHLHHRMEDALPSLDGERKVVTVLFADIVRSSDIVAGHDPEDANDHLLPVLQTMIDAVHRFGGTVNQILGDGIMAVFGAPFAQEDHAVRACLAAFSMQQATARLLARHPEPLVRNQAIRVGISSGKVVAQVLRGDLHTEYRIVGEAVYRAARLEKAAPAGAVLLCSDALALAADAVDTHSAGNVKLAEDEPSVSAFRLLGVGRRRSQIEARHIVDMPRFVGRDDDLAFLGDLWDNARGGFGEVAVISGDAGVGKSRLVSEFLAATADDGRRVVTCNLHPIGIGRAGGAMGRAVREALAGTMADAGAVIQRLAELGIDNAMAVNAVLDILDLSRGDPVWQESAPAERLRVAVDAAVRLVLAMAAERPLVMVLEDFHWADTRSKAFAAELSARSSGARLMVLVTCRALPDSPWASWPHVVERRLSPLAPRATESLLDAMLGHARGLSDLKRRLVELTQGVPLFVIECVRGLRQSGALTGPSGACQLVSQAPIEIPASVHALLAARIDRVAAADRYILLCASVIGAHFDVGLLQDLTGRRSTDLLMHLARLEQAGFVQRTRVVPNLEFSFQHALVQDVAYNTLLKSQRRGLHGRLLTALRQRKPGELPGRVELLAYHADRAEDRVRAVAYGWLAARQMLAASRNFEAAEFLERALDALAQLPESRRNRERGVDLRIDLVESEYPLGRPDNARRRLGEAEVLVAETGDQRRLAKLLSHRSLIHWAAGDVLKAIEVGKTSLKLARHRGDRELEILNTSRLGILLIGRGNFEAARSLLEKSIGLIPPDMNHCRFGLLPVASVSNRAALAHCLAELGHFGEAIRFGDEAVQIAEDVGHAFSQIYANLWVGHSLILKGDFQRSIPPLETCVALCARTGSELLYPSSASALGFAMAHTGRTAEGLALLELAKETASERGILWNYPQQLRFLAETRLLAGEHDLALKLATEALEASVRSGEKAYEAWSLWLLGEVHNALGAQPEPVAHRYYTKAWDMAKAHRMTPLVAHCHRGIGAFFMKHRAPRKAEEQFSAADSAYRGLDMRRWLDLTELDVRLTSDMRAQRVH